MAGEMEPLEGRKFALAIEEARDRLGEVGQIGPGVAGAAPRRIDDPLDRLAGLHHRRGKIAVAGGVRAKEIAGPHDQRRARRRSPPPRSRCSISTRMAPLRVPGAAANPRAAPGRRRVQNYRRCRAARCGRRPISPPRSYCRPSAGLACPSRDSRADWRRERSATRPRRRAGHRRGSSRRRSPIRWLRSPAADGASGRARTSHAGPERPRFHRRCRRSRRRRVRFFCWSRPWDRSCDRVGVGGEYRRDRPIRELPNFVYRLYIFI